MGPHIPFHARPARAHTHPTSPGSGSAASDPAHTSTTRAAQRPAPPPAATLLPITPRGVTAPASLAASATACAPAYAPAFVSARANISLLPPPSLPPTATRACARTQLRAHSRKVSTRAPTPARAHDCVMPSYARPTPNRAKHTSCLSWAEAPLRPRRPSPLPAPRPRLRPPRPAPLWHTTPPPLFRAANSLSIQSAFTSATLMEASPTVGGATPTAAGRWAQAAPALKRLPRRTRLPSLTLRQHASMPPPPPPQSLL
jgi:hypothetical protein